MTMNSKIMKSSKKLSCIITYIKRSGNFKYSFFVVTAFIAGETQISIIVDQLISLFIFWQFWRNYTYKFGKGK